MLAACGLVVVLPILVVSAILIRLNSRGPSFFRQTRVGFNGKPFTLVKLRTMATTQAGGLITGADDPRVTFIGKFLRKTKIDELPQLWNVLKGEMSFVGPRPEVPEFVDLSDPLWSEVLAHRPGITDPVTLRLRNEEQLFGHVSNKEQYYREVIQPFKLRGYVKFVREKDWKTDVRLIAKTLEAVAFPSSVKPPSQEELHWSFAD